jgi:hypothetical protein
MARFAAHWTSAPRPGSGRSMRARAIVGPVALALASIAAALVMWGFTVDDALISIRYARHLASGVGYRFDANGPSTDGVTPLPWPFVVVLFARGAPLAVLVRLKVLGIVEGAVAIAIASARERDAPVRAWVTCALAVAACLPLAAYDASGMETPLATLLCALCVFCNKDARGAIFAGLATSVRPELLPWAVAISVGFALARRASARVVITSVAFAGFPFAVCALARLAFFGHVAPLAVLAKPSDVAHGAAYAFAALVACGVPVLLATRGDAFSRAIAAAFAVHVLAVIVAGGDSMPYARLFVPLVPTIVAAHLHTASISGRGWFWLRSVIAIALAAFTFATAGPRGRDVMRDRADLIARATPLFASAHRVAAVDIGWVSAAYEGPILDLAGLTDPNIAVLAGGHTSKHVDASMLVERGVDTVVFQTDHDLYAHAVAVRIASDPLFRSRFVESASLPLKGTRGYVVFTRRALASPPSGASPR